MEIVHVGDERFESLWQRMFAMCSYQHALYQPCNMRFYEALVAARECDDSSFVIEDGNEVLLAVRFGVIMKEGGEYELSSYGLPVLYLENRSYGGRKLRKAYKLFKAEIELLIEQYSVKSIIYQDILDGGKFSYFGGYLMSKGGQAVSSFSQILDLSMSSDELRYNIRKSYRSLVSWGEKNLKLRALCSENISVDDMEQFRLLHHHASGRETRSRQTWDIQYEMIQQGEAFAIFGELDGALVTAVLCPYSPKHCYYGVSASKRELFSKPLSHALIWNAILYAKDLGCERFELGQQLYPNLGNPPPTQKELGISTFKHGFGGATYARTDIVWKR